MEEIHTILALFRFKLIPDLLLDVALIEAMLDGPEAARRSRFSAADSDQRPYRGGEYRHQSCGNVFVLRCGVPIAAPLAISHPDGRNSNGIIAQTIHYTVVREH